MRVIEAAGRLRHMAGPEGNLPAYRWKTSTTIGVVVLLTACIGGDASPAAAPAPIAATGGTVARSLAFDGRTRTYHLHIPPGYDAASAVPLVVVLHGGGGTGLGVERQSGMSAKADAAGFIAVYPDGTGRLDDRLLTWNTWNCCGYAQTNGVDDVGFIRTLVGQLQREYRIDAARVYATGLSNGGMMAYRLACDAADLFAAVAPVSGALNTDTCAPARPVSVVAFHGTDDQNIPYDGGTGTKSFPGTTPRRTDRSVAYATGVWVQNDGCTPTPQRMQTGSIVREEYTGGADGAAVTLYTIGGGGHAWPGGDRIAGFLDSPTQELSATDAMWAFFVQHPR